MLRSLLYLNFISYDFNDANVDIFIMSFFFLSQIQMRFRSSVGNILVNLLLRFFYLCSIGHVFFFFIQCTYFGNVWSFGVNFLARLRTNAGKFSWIQCRNFGVQ